MTLLIYDKFLDSYSKLPKEIQKKVMNFVQKFKNDSTSHSIHLEPIATFKDKNLRTARVDQKYRAIIHVPSSGDVSHLLWVDNHDEAMAWAENKIFEWNSKTQSYQVYEQIEHAADVPEKSGKRYFEQFSEEQLLQIGVPYPLLRSVEVINSFDELEALEEYLPRQAFESIYYILDGMPIDDVIKSIEEGKVKSVELAEQIRSFNNRHSFIEVGDDQEIAELLSGDLNKWKIFLHPTQRTLVKNNYNGSYKVTGAAGTGKTVVALHRLKELTPSVSKSNSILFTTFTKSLVANLKDSISSLSIDMNKVVVTNIHRLIVDFAKNNNIIEPDAKILDFSDSESKEMLWREVTEYLLSEFDIDFLMREYEDVVLFNGIKSRDEYLNVSRIGLEKPLGRKDRIKVWEIFEYFVNLKSTSKVYFLDEITNKLTLYFNQEAKKPFEFIIADEIQDFSDVELRLLRSMVNEKQNDLFLVGDPLQKIYKRQINFSRAGINIKGKKSTRLKINYRTTEEIKRSAISVIQGLTYDNFDGTDEEKSGYQSIFHGERPSIKVFQDTTEMNNELHSQLTLLSNEYNIKLNEICIGARNHRSINDIKKYLHVERIPYYDLTTCVGDKDGIVLSTFHNMKGLEFKVVILYDVSDTTIPYKYYGYDNLSDYEKNRHLKSEKSLMYVAMSRAIQRLYIMGVGKKCSFI
ncbi:MAG: DEAD/DEAH box helicase [Ignavibacteriales bacterium]|nr:DEAD/DEAH box helicase [Ignavibacteriales bacterium]